MRPRKALSTSAAALLLLGLLVVSPVPTSEAHRGVATALPSTAPATGLARSLSVPSKRSAASVPADQFWIPGPWPRVGASVAYDSTDGCALSFGGEVHQWQVAQSGSGRGFGVGYFSETLGDTWTSCGGPWHNASIPGATPATRAFAAIADDPADHGVLMFGGDSVGWTTQPYITTTLLNDTWLFHAGSWTELATKGPPTCYSQSMAYDPGDHEVVLADTCGYWSTQTWAFRGGTWTNITGSAGTAPSLQASTEMTTDPDTNGTLLVGAYGTTLQTWEFRSGTWTNLTSVVGWPSTIANSFGSLYLVEDLAGLSYSTSTHEAFTWMANIATERVEIWGLPKGGQWALSGSWNPGDTPGDEGPTLGYFLYDPTTGNEVVMGSMGDEWLAGPSGWTQTLLPGPQLYVGWAMSSVPTAGTPFSVEFNQEMVYGGMVPGSFSSWTFPPATGYAFSSSALPSVCQPVSTGFTCFSSTPLNLTFPATATDRWGRSSTPIMVYVSIGGTPGTTYGPYLTGWTQGELLGLLVAVLIPPVLAGVHAALRALARRSTKRSTGATETR